MPQTQIYTNSSEVPLALAVFLASDYYDHNPDPFTISATTLLKPIRQIVLPRRVDNSVGLINLADQMSNRLGAAIHDGIQRAWETNHVRALEALGYPKRVIDRVRINPTKAKLAADPDIIPVYMEQRLSKRVGKWLVTGKFDFIAEGQVEDFKTASVWSYKNQVNADKQIMQGSIYRWLDPELINKPTMRIHHIFMDWRASQVQSDPTYPKQRFHTQSFPLLDVTETDRIIRTKLSDIDRFMDADEDQLPHCTDEDLWVSDPVFKYYKSGDTTKRSTKNFDDRAKAMIFMSNEGKGQGVIKEVAGEARACKYCAAFPVCTQKDLLIEQGRLVV